MQDMIVGLGYISFKNIHHVNRCMAHANSKGVAAFKFPFVDFVVQRVATLFHGTTTSTIGGLCDKCIRVQIVCLPNLIARERKFFSLLLTFQGQEGFYDHWTSTYKRDVHYIYEGEWEGENIDYYTKKDSWCLIH